MPFNITFHDFTHGQLDQSLKSRSDLEVYNKGALELKNIVVRPGGAAKSRFGTQYISESVATAPGATVLIEPDPTVTVPVPGYQMFDFAPSDDVKLLVILGAGDGGATPGISQRFQFYVVRNVSGAGPAAGTFTTVALPANTFIDNNQVSRVKYRVAQNQTTMVIVTATQPPLVLSWAGTTIEGENLNYRRFPQHDFTRNGYVESTFGIRTDNTSPALPGTPIFLKPTPAAATLGGSITDDFPALIIDPLVATPNFAGFYFDGVTPDNHYVGGVIQMAGPIDDPTAPIGYAIIVSTTAPAAAPYPACSNTVCRIRIITPVDASWRVTNNGPFPAGQGVKGDQCVLTEPAYSSPVTPVTPTSFPGRGHPRTVSFYESRLCFAGSPSLPQSIFMSQIGNFENFDVGTGEPDEAIAYTIASGAQDQVINMVSGRSLQVFTTTNEFSAPVWSEQGLTPTTVTIRRQTSIGSSNCIPAILDNMTMYSKRGGRGIMAFESINSGGNTYNSQDASMFSSELINNPTHMTSYVESEAYDANILFVINKPNEDEPGYMVLYESLREQNVSAWTSADTQGEFVNVEAVGDAVYIMTKRVNGVGTEKFVLEKLNWRFCMDAAIQKDAINPAGGIQPAFPVPTYFWGKEVDIIAWVGEDSRAPSAVWIGEETVPNTGFFGPTIPGWDPADLPPGALYEYWIGLKYEQRLQTMPVDVKTQIGSMLFLKKKIFKCYIEYIDSYPFFVNGVEADLRSLAFGTGQFPPGYQPGIQLNAPEPPYSGIWMRPTMQKLNLPPSASGPAYRGFVREATILVTLDRPLPMTIQGITAATS